MKSKNKTRIAIIDRELCLKERCGYQCEKVCPGVRMGDETVVVDSEGFPIISEELCTGCGICPKRCPAKCIMIINLMGEGDRPIYQYGINAFRLYGLPVPQKGVVGLIGKNGIGKSTAIKLMAGGIRPNFGEFGRKFSDDEILEKLQPELQNYFRSLKEKRLKVSLKPQNIHKIPELFKGRAGELLEKSDERKVKGEAIKAFQLDEVMDKKTGELSGGELQRLAVAAAYCKDADLYYFDEPAAYLDVKQRLSCARALKGLGGEKSVVVVEHDLAVFDYISDYAHVLYGQENAYGVVSGVKAARKGVNEYLDGFLTDENTRFRDHAIKFSTSSAGKTKSKKVKYAYPSFEKKFERFSFSSDEGSVMEGEILGILGENATGKSLFVKMVAGLEKPDNCEVKLEKVKISYKPQYVKPHKGVEVRKLFSESGLDMAFSEEAKRKLSVNMLMEKELCGLSGGELQRVAIALTLSRKADIYLFDEPSAFLDIEQRLEFACLLHHLISGSDRCAFVVEHDLVLLDAVSSRMAVFTGMPGKDGKAGPPMEKREGMNQFLKSVGVTLRRDIESKRPRINKPGSMKDREQKEKGEYYYYEK